jgi:uncharacterized membrane protein YdjX (TVP38/TMEM64 family)
MVKLLSSFLPVLACCFAYAQSSTAEAPAEHASLLTVVIFLVLFIGTCVAFVGYTWWQHRKKGQRGAE